MLHPELPARWAHLHWPETDSTMCRLLDAEVAERDEEFVLVTADYQRAGRGQRGTHWEAERGSNLLFGFRFSPTFLRADEQFRLSEALALAVAGAVGSLVPDVSIKWPNDVYYRDGKICGMLLEHDLQGSHIGTTRTGVGLNVNQRTFTGDAPNPVSLRQILGRETDRDVLLTDILRRFDADYRLLQAGGGAALDRRYAEALYRREGFFPYHDAGGEFLARIEAVAPNGQLTLVDEAGHRRSYAFKEVAYVLPAFVTPGPAAAAPSSPCPRHED